MTKYTLAGLTLLALTASPLASPAVAQDSARTMRASVRPDSRLWIEGTSNLHGWSCKATTLDAAIEVDSVWTAALAKPDVDFPKLVKRVNVRVPVEGLKCGNDKMDRIMYEALKANEAPDISYILGNFEAATANAPDTFVVHTTGTLRIAGKENPVQMDVRAERLADGVVRAEGAVAVLMTDYGVKPPTALFGTLRTGNKVTVKFELFVGPQTLIAAAYGANAR